MEPLNHLLEKENLMPSLLESLYYGNLNPVERVVSNDPQYRQLNR